jgi:cobalt-precorrin 5A hydrolase
MGVAEAMIVAGIGSASGVTAAEVLAAVDAACAAHAVEPSDLEALAVPEMKTDEPGIHAAAQTLKKIVLVIGRAELEAAGAGSLTHSARSLEATGAPSASEATALAAIGAGAKLLGPRVAAGRVTCALAYDGVLP